LYGAGFYGGILKKKLLIVYNKVWTYRLCIFNILADKYDLTIAVNDESYLDKSYKFNVIYLPTRSFGPFEWHTNNLRKLFNKYDCIIGLYDIRWLRLMLTSLVTSKPFLLWGIGVTASYQNHFDSKQTWDSIRLFFAKRSSGVLLYSDYPVERHIKLGLSKEKIWVAHNTTDVESGKVILNKPKDKLLFVGSLYKEKCILEVVNSYLKAYSQNPQIPQLHIVGDGEDFLPLKSFVNNNNLGKKVILHGAIYDNAKLGEIFETSLVCLSPNQAGLSVLKSMGSGVPFATNTNAITGGEIFNIHHMENGIIIDKLVNSLAEFFLWVPDNKDLLELMGKNAHLHYDNTRRPRHTTEIISMAIDTSIEKVARSC